MRYQDYQLIIDLLDEFQKKREKDYRIAIGMGAKHDDVAPSLDACQANVADIKKTLKECVLAYVKEQFPDNLALQKFWNCRRTKNENN